MSAMEKSLNRLKLDYVDLILIHGPGIYGEYKLIFPEEIRNTFPENPEDLKEARISMWEALQELKKQGKTREIGVSNFNRFHLQQLMNNPRCLKVPVINQIEFNPYSVDNEIIDFCKENGILVQAYAPLGSNPGRKSRYTHENTKHLLEDEILLNIPKEKECTVAQVALSWALSKGIAVVTKTEKPVRMKENISALNIKLTDEDIKTIDKLNLNQRLFWNPNKIL